MFGKPHQPGKFAGIRPVNHFPFVVGTARANLKTNAVAAGNQVSKNVIIVTRLLYCSRRSKWKV
jgi:hypothetical protein